MAKTLTGDKNVALNNATFHMRNTLAVNIFLMLRAIIIAIFIFSLSGCNAPNRSDFEEIMMQDKLESYFKYALLNPSDGSIDDVYDSISRKIISENISIVQIYHVGIDLFSDSSNFIIETFDPYEDPGLIYKRNALEINIFHQDSIIIDNTPCKSEYIINLLDEFYENPKELPNLSEKEEMKLPIIGNVSVSKGIIGIGNNNVAFESINKYFNIYFVIEEYFKQRRNNLANMYFLKTMIN